MSNELDENETNPAREAGTAQPADPLRPLLVQFPGLALIALYLLALSVVIILGVVAGGIIRRCFSSLRQGQFRPARGC
jgi:hypothetical protein